MTHLIYTVDDQKSQCILNEETLKALGYRSRFFSSAKSCLQELEKEEKPSLILLDLIMPEMNGHEMLQVLQRKWPNIPVVVQTVSHSVEDAVYAMQLGARDYITRPSEPERIKISIENALKETELNHEITDLKRKLSEKNSCEDNIPKNKEVQKCLHLAHKVAPSNVCVLIQGERGAGKKSLARMIHQLSNQKGSLITLDCKNLPNSICKDENTSLKNARNGTLVLLNIDILSQEGQDTLLECISNTESEFSFTKLNIRLIALTTKDLSYYNENGNFSAELLWRLNVFPLKLPPLRNRKEDIAILAQKFIERINQTEGTGVTALSGNALKLLKKCKWPGNITQLKNAIYHAATLAGNGPLMAEHFRWLKEDETLLSGQKRNLPSLHEAEIVSLRDLEKRHICCTLAFYNSNISKSAKRLGVSRSTLYRKMEEYEISPS